MKTASLFSIYLLPLFSFECVCAREFPSKYQNSCDVIVHHTPCLHCNPRDVLLKEAARFLDVKLTEDTEDIILEHRSFKNMKENSTVNSYLGQKGFIRKGIVGDWENYFTVAQNKEFEKIYEQRMDGTDLNFEW